PGLYPLSLHDALPISLRPLGVAGWRWLFVAGSLGGVIVWSLRRLLPESPRWLESAGKTSEAAQIANEFARTDLTEQGKPAREQGDRKSTRLNSSHGSI